MKKSLSIILSLAMVCTMSATAFAADSSTDLSAIADATIQVTQTTSESGAITNTFNNLDDFVNAVHTANPAISDYEIATYILDYTG
jgi:peptidoglycan hydrolase CwlO-like protein